MGRRLVAAWALITISATAANAQPASSNSGAVQSTPQTQTSSTSGSPEATRPATTTFSGDTGLWFVPTAEVLPHKQWSGSGYRRGTNYVQGFSNVGDFAGTFGVGFRNRAELFGSWNFITRIDRDIRPLFQADDDVGGSIDRYPFMNTTWTGNKLGDFSLGAKYNFWSQADQKPAAMAVRGVIKLPTGDDEVSTGATDFQLDFVFSKETGRIEVAGYGGWDFRGQPEDFEGPGGAFRWGGGLGFPARGGLRGTFELQNLHRCVRGAHTRHVSSPSLNSS